MKELAKELLKKLNQIDFTYSGDEYALGVRDTLKAIFENEHLQVGKKQTSLLDIHEKLLKSEVF